MNQIHVCIHRGRYVVEQKSRPSMYIQSGSKASAYTYKSGKTLETPRHICTSVYTHVQQRQNQIHICINRGRYVVYQKLTAHIQNSNKASVYACKAGARPGAAISVYTCVYTCKQASAYAYIHVLEIKSIGMYISWSCNKLNETHAQS